MKKFGLVVIAMLMLIPIGARADVLGTGYMDLSASPPAEGGLYLDYDAKITSAALGKTGQSEEVFCVSSTDMSDGNFTFYSIGSGLPSGFDVPTLSRAAWIADNWTTYIGSGDADVTKGEAQKAVWEVMNVTHLLGTDGLDLKIYNESADKSVTSGWVLAYDHQDFLVHVPEPAALLLLGFGLVGLAGARKKLKK